MAAVQKTRLDLFLVALQLSESQDMAQRLIRAHQVLVNDRIQSKPGFLCKQSDQIRIKTPTHSYVSRGALKLEGALEQFGLSVSDRVALDIGISTGGFTDLLCRRNARYVFGVDVGYGLVAMSLRQSKKVILLERTNARHLTLAQLESAATRQKIPTQVAHDISLLVIDVSFISVVTILTQLHLFLTPGTDCLVLIKPQFEAPKHLIPPGGVIQDTKIQRDVLSHTCDQIKALGYEQVKETASSITGTKGNQEYVVWFRVLAND